MIRSNNKFDKPKAGVLPFASPRFRDLGKGLSRGSFHDRKIKALQEITSALEEHIDVVPAGIVYETRDVQNAMNSFYAEKVDFVIVEFLSWSEDFAWIRFLRDMPDVPILLVNPVREKMSFDSSLDEDDFIDFLCAGTLVGSLEAGGSIPRIGRLTVKILVGNRIENLDQVIRFSKAAKVRSVLKNSIFGVLANYNELMWATYIDPYNLFSRIGPELRFISWPSLQESISAIKDSEVIEWKLDLLSEHKTSGNIDEKQFKESLRVSIGLGKISEQLGLDALIFNDVDPVMLNIFGLRPGFYHPSFNKNLSVLVPEADVGGGMITFILKLISGKHVNFIEPFHIEEQDNCFAGGHAGPNDHNDIAFRDQVIISRDVRFAKTNYKYAGAPFAWYRISPGRKTMAHFSENNGTYKLVATLVDSLEGDHIFASYTHSIFRPVIPVKQLFQKLLNIGTTQHFAIADGNYLTELSMLAEIMGFEYHEII